MWRVEPPTGNFFSEEHRKQIEVLFNTIVPGGDGAPSAMDVGAPQYLDCLLAMDEATYYEIPEWRRVYREGLPALEAASQALFSCSLVAVPGHQLVELLEKLSEGALPGFPETIDQKKFFQVLRSHCIEGCFADPRWGGNRDGLMWRWFGYLQEAEEIR